MIQITQFNAAIEGGGGFGAHGNAHAIASVEKGRQRVQEIPVPFLCSLSSFEKILFFSPPRPEKILLTGIPISLCTQSCIVEGQTEGLTWAG